MRTLETYYKNGYNFSLNTRCDDFAVFRGMHKITGHETYETIIIQSHNGREIHGTYCPPAEYPPSNEQWGSKGWTFTDYVGALGKLNALISSTQEK